MEKVVAVIGGRESQVKGNRTYSFDVFHYDKRVKSKVVMRSLDTVVKKADVVLLMTDACSHEIMYRARRLSK